ncbi:MAG: single-stranded DNA-binding protein [Clostridiales bacterium]|nr:single-stranded DNA-binding protein [Clostridiales bacterium]
MNKVIIIGRLTKDPDLRFAAGTGTAVCRFTVAVNRRKKDDGADFINCVSFGKTAETIAQYFTKGSQIAVSGSIRTGSYDAQDGTKRYTTDVAVDGFNFIDSNGQSGNTQSEQGAFNDDITPVDDGDMPFN